MTLIEILARLPFPVFSVVDGAILEDAPEALSAAGLPSRPLYGGDFEAIGIHFVTLDDAAAIERFLSIFPDDPRAVFWSWLEGEDALFRHLRRLGKVEVPKAGTNPNEPEFDAVVFRHADPESLMKVLTVLTSDQLRDFFGAARGIVLQHRTPRGPQMVRMASEGRILRDPAIPGAATAVPAVPESA